MSSRSDAELMALSAKGETAAFAELVERYQNILLNFFMRRGVSWDDGQDLAQQTFLRLWNYRKKYTAQAKFTTFLFLLAGQVSVDFFRAEGRRRGLEEDLAHEAEVASDASLEQGARRRTLLRARTSVARWHGFLPPCATWSSWACSRTCRMRKSARFWASRPVP